MSAGEIIVIFVVYLLFFGSKGLPTLAQTLGKAIYQFRNAAGEVQREIMNSANEIKKQVEVRLDQEDVQTSIPQSPAYHHSPEEKNAGDNTNKDTSLDSTSSC